MNTPEEIVAARKAAGHTQAKAAEVALVSLNTWTQYESGRRLPSAAVKEIYLLKTGQHPTHIITARPDDEKQQV